MPGEMVDFLWESTSSIFMAFLSVLLINCLKIEGPALFDQAVLSIRDNFKVHNQALISDGPTWSDEETSSGNYLDLLNNFSVADFSDSAPFVFVPSVTESAPVPQINDPHQDQFDVTTYTRYTGLATVAFPNVQEAPPTSAILDVALEMLANLSWPAIALSKIDFASILFGINFLLIVAVAVFLGLQYKRQIRTLEAEVSARKAEIAILSARTANLTNASVDTNAMLTVLQKDVYEKADNVEESTREHDDQHSEVHNTKLELESYRSDIEEKLAISKSDVEKLTTKVEAKLDAKLEATNRSIEKLVTSFEAKLLASNSNIERLIINVEKQHEASNSNIEKLATNVEAKLEASNSKMEKLATNVRKKLATNNNNIEKLATNVGKLATNNNNIEKLAIDVEKKLGASNSKIEKLATDVEEKHGASNSKIEKLATDVEKKLGANNSNIEMLATDVKEKHEAGNSNIVKLATDVDKKLRANHSNIQKLVTHVEKKLGTSHSNMVTLETNVAELDRRQVSYANNQVSYANNQVSYANRVEEIQGMLSKVMVDFHGSVNESKESMEAAHQSLVDTVDVHCASFETLKEEVRCLRHDYEEMKKKLASPLVAAEPARSGEQSPTTSHLSIQLASPYLSIQPVATEPARSGEQTSRIPRLSIQPVVTILSIPPAAAKPASTGEQKEPGKESGKESDKESDKESGKESSKESGNVSGNPEDEPKSGKDKQKESTDGVVDQGQSRVDDDELYDSSNPSSPVRSTGASDLPTEPELERKPRSFRFLADAEYDAKSHMGRRRQNIRRRQYEESVKQTLPEKGESSNSPPAGRNPFARDFRPGEIRVDGKLIEGTGGLVLPKGPKALSQTTKQPQILEGTSGLVLPTGPKALSQTTPAPIETPQAPSQTPQAPSQPQKKLQLASRWAPKGQD